MSILLGAVAHFILSVISRSGYLGIAGLMAIESACVPLPSEIIMPFSGFLAANGRFSLFWVALAGTVGCNVGSIAAYAIGSKGGRPLVEKYGRYVLLTRHDLEWADRWFARYGEGTVFVARLLPVIRTFIALPAGIARMNFARFNLYTFLGSFPWCWALAWAGFRLGKRWTILEPYFKRADDILAVAILLGILWFVRNRWKNRMR